MDNIKGKPIETLDQAKAFLLALIVSDLMYHLEDDAEDCLEGKVSTQTAQLINQRVRECYELDWSNFECPLGYCLFLDTVLGLTEK